MHVCVDGSSSDVLPVSSGVPQGSVLGPILFIICIDGITKVALTAGNLSLFADDILLYRPIQNIEDFAFLQNDVTKLCSWTNDNFTLKTNLLFYQIIWLLQLHDCPSYANSKNVVLVKHFVGG